MRILFMTYPGAFITPGGGEIQLLRTREYLRRLGVTVALFDPWEPRLHDYDLAHFFSVHGGTGGLVDLVRAQGLPVVVSPNLWMERGAAKYPCGEIQHVFARSRAVIANSQAEQVQFERFFDLPNEPYRVVPNAVDPSFATGPGPGPFRAQFGLGDFVLCVANVEERKNQLALARATRRVGLPLVLLGGVRDPAYLEACIMAGEGHVHHVPRIDHDSPLLKSAYQACRVHALVSWLETPGLAALEAAALGAPCVVTERGAAFEYFGDDVEYVDPASEESIVRALGRSLERGRDARSAALQQWVLTQFTWPQVAERMRDVYASILGDGVRRAS